MYRIEFDNGLTLNEVGMIGGTYTSEREIDEGMFSGVKGVVIKTDDGCEKRIRRAKIDVKGKIGESWRFMIRELTKEERAEETRKRKLDSQNEWIKEKYDRVSITLPKGTKERITSLGESVNGFVNEAVEKLLNEREVAQ